MQTLSTHHRRELERAVADAREIAERGAQAALESLAVDRRQPFEHMSDEQRVLRRRLRVHARHLGDKTEARSGTHEIDHLIQECACEHWHAMLFARFLAENGLLIEPDLGIHVTLDECEELAKEEGTDRWSVASRFAQGMLPQVFRPEHPVFGLRLAREHRMQLEELVEGLAVEVFTASDALGWVYEFWQARNKDAVNRSEVKIGADELPAVTQLFTEPYMVQFLLHNSLGAWWVSRHPNKPCPVDLTYLRRGDDGAPAAGIFDAWPDDLSEFRLLDPCCGSGHFLVAALLMLAPMRMAAEELDASTAVAAVLEQNIHGLELDRRCVAIAAFALALEAWRYPGAGGHRRLPSLNLAWCGQPVSGKEEEWLSLAEGDANVEAGMAILHDSFRDAPTLGSLINPARSARGDMLAADFDQLRPLLERALQTHAGEAEVEETAIAALGLAEAAQMLTARFHLVATNVPYLARGKQNERLRRFCESRFNRARSDLANVFLERCLELVADGGTTQVVMPQNWLFLKRYSLQRKGLLRDVRWQLLARLGEGGFASSQAAGAFTILLTLTATRPSRGARLQGIDASQVHSPLDKAQSLGSGELIVASQHAQLGNPDAIVTLAGGSDATSLLSQFAYCYQGTSTGDNARFVRSFWEVPSPSMDFVYFQGPSEVTEMQGGKQNIVRWDEVLGFESAAIRGEHAWGSKGIAIGQMRSLPATLFEGSMFSNATPVIIPRDPKDFAALWCYCSSAAFGKALREINQKLSVDNGYVSKISVDFEHWRRQAMARFPDGLPLAYSSSMTQWVFHGHPCGSVVWDKQRRRTVHGTLRSDEKVLHVAVARLLGYRWPAEQNPDMELADEQRKWTARCETLRGLEDEDGIVCIPSVRGERAASERLLDLIRESFGDDWREDIPGRLLGGSRGTSLDDWLRNRFFDEHCKLFHHRPFVWHVWDGRKRDGFHALVNYHRLAEGNGKGRQLLESLTYSYLGDWIARQRDGVARAEAGSDDRLAAALELQKRLTAILDGEPPFDLFVRWKPLSEQALGWNPDVNDGVRLNIRPFLADDIPGGKKGAGVLRSKPNVHWQKDRGKEPVRDESDFPWFWKDGEFTEKRVNDVHLTVAEKRAASAAAVG